LGGFQDRFSYKPPVQTFESLRTDGTTKKVVVAKVPLKKSQITNYFDQIRETKDWQRMIEHKTNKG